MSFARRSPFRQTVAFRLALWYAGIFAAALVGVVALTYGLLARSLEERDRELVRTTLVECARRWETAGPVGVRLLLQDKRSAGEKGEVFVRVLDGSLDALFLSTPPGWSDVPPVSGELPRPGSGLTWRMQQAGRRGIVFEMASMALPDGTLIQAGRSTELREELLARFRRVLFLAGGVVLLFGVAGGAVVTHEALRPLRELNDAVRRTVETGDLEARVPTRGTGDPLDDLGAAFNALLTRISGLVKAMRESLDNAAHDLRTPLARLRAVGESALRTPDHAPALREGLETSLEEAERVTSLLNELMDLSEAEAGAMRLAIAPVKAAALLGQAVDLFADSAEEKGIDLAAEVDEALVVAVDAGRMRQVLANLLDNALKFTPAGGTVRLAARSDGDAAVVTVTDDGTGMTAEELPRIFDRLYRGDRSRSERGLGIGLALVKAIVAAHGGTVTAESEPGKGARFTVRLPGAVRPDPSPL